MKTKLLVMTLVSALGAAAAHADVQKKQIEFCQALSDFHSDMKSFDALGPNSTIAELKAAAARFEDDGKKVMKTAGKIKTATGQAFTMQVSKLKKDAQGLPENLTVQQAKERLADDIQRVKGAEAQLTAESGCPEEAAPIEKKGMEPKSDKGQDMPNQMPEKSQ